MSMKLLEIHQDDYTTRPLDIDVHDAANLISTHCKDMLEACISSGRLLYRGISEQRMGKDFIVSASIRPDRQPVEMLPGVHSLLEKAFKKVGLVANRSNSIFTCARAIVADKWGEPYAVFVYDGWHATVFDDSVGAYSFGKLQKEGHRILNQDADDYNHDEEVQLARMVEIVKQMQPHDLTNSSELAHELERNNIDILVTGRKFVAVHVGYRDDDKDSYELFKLLGIGL